MRKGRDRIVKKREAKKRKGNRNRGGGERERKEAGRSGKERVEGKAGKTVLVQKSELAKNNSLRIDFFVSVYLGASRAESRVKGWTIYDWDGYFFCAREVTL